MERLPKYDCHCHILPGLDDWAQTLEDSLYLAGQLAAYGFERAVCTSHSSFLFRNTPGTVIPACERLQEGFYSFLGTDMHNRKYADQFDKILL